MKSNQSVRTLFTLTSIVCTLALSAFACAGQQKAAHGPTADIPKVQIPADSDAYILGPEDVITVTVRNVPEMSADYMIQLDGTLYFPVVGQVKAGGMSAKELKKFLEEG